jgi:hypothetical protein
MCEAIVLVEVARTWSTPMFYWYLYDTPCMCNGMWHKYCETYPLAMTWEAYQAKNKST